jgi:hypothetical protein
MFRMLSRWKACPNCLHPIEEKILAMLTAKGEGGRIHVRHAGNTAYVDEDIPPVDTFDAQRQRLRLSVQLAQLL